MMLPFTVILPVRNEAAQLAKTAPALKKAAMGLPAEIIYVLNATKDESRSIILETFDDQVNIIELVSPGKTSALRAGDAAASRCIRVYLDADVLVVPDTLSRLLSPLFEGEADLVAPEIRPNLGQANGLARRVGRVWADQLARRQDAFMCCTAMSANAIKDRGIWPDVLADDDWARSRIAAERRMMVDTAVIEISPPCDLINWLKVRARWIRGARELRQLGIEQTRANEVRPRGNFVDLATYYLVRLLAEPLAYFQQKGGVDWGRDNSTRAPNRG